ncbi:MAG: acetate--CoA ligase family protein [Sulfolobales archaeon]
MVAPKELIYKALEDGRNKLLEHEAYEFLKAYDLPVPKFGLAVSADEAAELAERIGYPVVLKIVSPDIVHKSDVGGVKVNISSESEVRKWFDTIIQNVRSKAPTAKVAGILVQEMVPQDLEVIVGSTRDPVFGPVVMFGLGGIFVEVLKDVSLRITPITVYDAEEMIREIRAASILEGYRGAPPRDKKAIIDLIIKVGRLMDEVPEVTDIDLNPVMVFPEGRGAKIADARILIKRV